MQARNRAEELEEELEDSEEDLGSQVPPQRMLPAAENPGLATTSHTRSGFSHSEEEPPQPISGESQQHNSRPPLVLVEGTPAFRQFTEQVFNIAYNRAMQDIQRNMYHQRDQQQQTTQHQMTLQMMTQEQQNSSVPSNTGYSGMSTHDIAGLFYQGRMGQISPILSSSTRKPSLWTGSNHTILPTGHMQQVSDLDSRVGGNQLCTGYMTMGREQGHIDRSTSFRTMNPPSSIITMPGDSVLAQESNISTPASQLSTGNISGYGQLDAVSDDFVSFNPREHFQRQAIQAEEHFSGRIRDEGVFVTEQHASYNSTASHDVDPENKKSGDNGGEITKAL